jgi:hypothetical protein
MWAFVACSKLKFTFLFRDNEEGILNAAFCQKHGIQDERTRNSTGRFTVHSTTQSFLSDGELLTESSTYTIQLTSTLSHI